MKWASTLGRLLLSDLLCRGVGGIQETGTAPAFPFVNEFYRQGEQGVIWLIFQIGYSLGGMAEPLSFSLKSVGVLPGPETL